ncbi:MAG: hypothetical protein JWQ44_2959 [Chthoniobacter sp.]|nr:hypothetical protein [Chthoniobacter sp.]
MRDLADLLTLLALFADALAVIALFALLWAGLWLTP